MRNLLGVTVFTVAVAAAAACALAAPPPHRASPQLATGQPAPDQPATVASDAVATLQKVCLPVLRGSDLKASARAAGFRLHNGVWAQSESGDRLIELNPPDPVNPHDCGATISAQAADDPALLASVDTWARAQSPPLVPVKSQVLVPGLAATWQTSTWQAETPAGEESVALSQQKPAAASPLDTPSQTNLLISLTPA